MDLRKVYSVTVIAGSKKSG